MDLVHTYELIYTGMTQPQHLLQMAKSQMNLNALTQTENAKLAEFFLRVAKFDEIKQAKTRAYGLQGHDVSSINLADNIKHIHAAKSQEIRERFSQPEISDDEAADLLFKIELEHELAKITPKRKEIIIDL